MVAVVVVVVVAVVVMFAVIIELAVLLLTGCVNVAVVVESLLCLTFSTVIDETDKYSDRGHLCLTPAFGPSQSDGTPSTSTVKLAFVLSKTRSGQT